MKKKTKKILKNLGIKVEKACIANDPQFHLHPSYDMLIWDLIRRVSDPLIVVIGANDGLRSDPLFSWIQEYDLRAILVEPLPDVFSRLIENYKSLSKVTFENYCVSKEIGNVAFFRLKENYSSYACAELNRKNFDDRISSLSVNHIMKHVGYSGDWRDIIEKVLVPSITFEELLDKHKLDKVDILQIDAEGYDLEILKMIDFQVICPNVICFEHINLHGRDYSQALSLITEWGYKWTQDGYNVIAQKSF